jgi:pimeloyl-ACP methyl ester carboxylesterase
VPQDHDEHPIAWREAGPPGGPLVVLLHGLGGSRISWEPQLAALAAAGFRALAWDQPGYGASDPPPAWNFGVLTTAAARWIERVDERAHVVGLSFGGMVAQHLALAHPVLVKSLVLADTSPAFGLDGETTPEDWTEARLAPLRAGETPATIAEGVLRSIMAPDAHGLEEATAAMSRISPLALEDAVRCLTTHDVRDRLHEIDVPTLVVVGEHDRETPPSYSEHLAASIPGARLVVVPGAGHLTPTERPDAFDAELVAFLREVSFGTE